jgi:acetylornithine deacetylase
MVAALRRLQVEVAAGRPAATKDDVPYTTLHVGRIEGGIALNIVPDRCRFDFEIRNLPGESASALMQRLEAEAGLLAAAHRQRFAAAGIEIAVTNAYPSLSTPSEDPVVTTLLCMTGTPKPIGVAFGTEGGLFREALGCTTVVCGPGSMQQGHRPDEYIEQDQLGGCSRFLDRLVGEICR